MQRAHICSDKVKDDARILSGKPIDDGGNKARGQKVGATDSHFSGSGIGEKLDVLYSLTEIIECCRSSIEQNSAALCERGKSPGSV